MIGHQYSQLFKSRALSSSLYADPSETTIKKNIMKHAQICFEIPQNILYTLSQNQDEFIRQMRLFTAQYLFKSKKLTFGQAAELADMSKADFLNELDISGIDLIDYDASELSEELARFQP